MLDVAGVGVVARAEHCDELLDKQRPGVVCRTCALLGKGAGDPCEQTLNVDEELLVRCTDCRADSRICSIEEGATADNALPTKGECECCGPLPSGAMTWSNVEGARADEGLTMKGDTERCGRMPSGGIAGCTHLGPRGLRANINRGAPWGYPGVQGVEDPPWQCPT